MSEVASTPPTAGLRWGRALIPAALILPLVVILALSFGNDPHAVPFVLADKAAPAFELAGLDGGGFSLGSAAGKVVVVNFWASWCEPCKVEHELLQEVARAYEPNVVFLGVVYQDEDDKARAYLAKRTNRFLQLRDPDSKVAIDYGVAGVPETFFIDRRGIVRFKHAGAIDRGTLLKYLSTLLERP